MDFSKTFGNIVITSVAHFWKKTLKMVIKVTKVKLVVRMTLIPLIDLDLSWVAKAIKTLLLQTVGEFLDTFRFQQKKDLLRTFRFIKLSLFILKIKWTDVGETNNIRLKRKTLQLLFPIIGLEFGP